MHTVPSRCGQCGSHCGPTWPVLTEHNLGCSRTGLKLDSENRGGSACEERASGLGNARALPLSWPQRPQAGVPLPRRL